MADVDLRNHPRCRAPLVVLSILLHTLKNCYAVGNSAEPNEICRLADDYRVRRTFVPSTVLLGCITSIRQIKNIYVPTVGDQNPYDLRQNSLAPSPRVLHDLPELSRGRERNQR